MGRSGGFFEEGEKDRPECLEGELTQRLGVSFFSLSSWLLVTRSCIRAPVCVVHRSRGQSLGTESEGKVHAYLSTYLPTIWIGRYDKSTKQNDATNISK